MQPSNTTNIKLIVSVIVLPYAHIANEILHQLVTSHIFHHILGFLILTRVIPDMPCRGLTNEFVL